MLTRSVFADRRAAALDVTPAQHQRHQGRGCDNRPESDCQVVGEEGSQKRRLGGCVPLQGQQHQGAAQTAVTDRRNPTGRHLLAGQVDQQAQQQGHQHRALRSDRGGIELQR
jgi:hypothetical protein